MYENKRYKPKIDRLFWIIVIPINLLLFSMLILASIGYIEILYFILPLFLFVNYFVISPLFGYVELRENELFIKYGFLLKKHIPYNKIRSATIERKWYSESMLALKNAFEHINIKYNSFDVTTVSVKNNEDLKKSLEERMG